MDNFNKYYYKPFDKFVFRTPYFPIKRLIRWLPKLDNSYDYLKDILSYSEIKEAIFLASPELYGEIIKYQEDQLCLKDKKKFLFFWGGQFGPATGGQDHPAEGGQFSPARGGFLCQLFQYYYPLYILRAAIQ